MARDAKKLSAPAKSAKATPAAKPFKAVVTHSDALPLEKELLLSMHDTMVKARCLEERLIAMYKTGHGYFWIGGPGEEAFNVPLGLLIKKGSGPAFDYCHFHYRQSATLLAMGEDPMGALRQMKNTALDPYSGGRNFAGHFSKKEWNIAPVSSPIEVQYAMAPGTALVQKRFGGDGVTIVTLNRPQALNALNSQILAELTTAFAAYDADPGQRCLVLTGSEKAFAAGADIKEMSDQSFASMYASNFFAGWERVTATRKPWIAAVNGFALGGGCEVAMMADFIVAGDNAKFGQPEIKLGVTPGMGGSQRLTRAIGKAKAMEMCLTGRMMGAEEAERSGLVARVVPAAELVDEALKTASLVAAMPPLATSANKEMVNAAFETTLTQGIIFERRLFHGLFGTEDQSEGMAAFVEKRPGNWTGK
jgi:enoyl-CoA hydratase